ncbi:MAG: hypothetical protein OXB93_02795 [Cytophagales bacterium]|nr:hypothetical protein [Cytophagales bacterium]
MNISMLTPLFRFLCLLLIPFLFSFCGGGILPDPFPDRTVDTVGVPEVLDLARSREGCSDPGAINYAGRTEEGEEIVALENDDCSCVYAEFEKPSVEETRIVVKNIFAEAFTSSRLIGGALVQVLLDIGETAIYEFVNEKVRHPVDFQFIYVVTHSGGSEVTDFTKDRFAEFEFPASVVEESPPLINIDNVIRAGFALTFPLDNERVLNLAQERLTIYSTGDIFIDTKEKGEIVEGLLAFKVVPSINGAIVAHSYEAILVEDSVFVANQNNAGFSGRSEVRTHYPSLFSAGRTIPSFLYRFVTRERILKGKIFTPYAILDGKVYSRFFSYKLPEENSLTKVSYRKELFHIVVVLYRDDTNEVVNCTRIKPGGRFSW